MSRTPRPSCGTRPPTRIAGFGSSSKARGTGMPRGVIATPSVQQSRFAPADARWFATSTAAEVTTPRTTGGYSSGWGPQTRSMRLSSGGRTRQALCSGSVHWPQTRVTNFWKESRNRNRPSVHRFAHADCSLRGISMRYLVPAFILVTIAAVVGMWALKERRADTPPPENTPKQPPEHSALPPEPEPTLPPGVQLNFVDATVAAGIDFRYFDGRTEMEYLMDSTGPGAAWIDYDQDGLLDLFLVQGSSVLPPHPPNAPACKLYRNLGQGKFQDVTAAANVESVGCGQGATVGDIDNDGFPDLFVTYYGKPNVL